MKILCFGNPHIEGDSLSLELGEELDIEGVDFEICYYPEEIFSHRLNDVVIMDVVKGLRDVRLIETIDDFAHKKSSTAHDMDLGYFLKLKKELGELDEIKIIGIPPEIDKKEAKQKVEKIIENLL